MPRSELGRCLHFTVLCAACSALGSRERAMRASLHGIVLLGDGVINIQQGGSAFTFESRINTRPERYVVLLASNVQCELNGGSSFSCHTRILPTIGSNIQAIPNDKTDLRRTPQFGCMIYARGFICFFPAQSRLLPETFFMSRLLSSTLWVWSVSCLCFCLLIFRLNLLANSLPSKRAAAVASTRGAMP